MLRKIAVAWQCLDMWGIVAFLRGRASCLPNTGYWAGSANSVVIKEEK